MKKPKKMRDSSVYLVKMLPLGGYFFGGEKNFGLDVNTDYLVRSRLLPQQTTLLGMIRQQLLTVNNLLKNPEGNQPIKKKKAAAELIGNTGFRVGSNAGFGIIEEISSIFISKEGERFYPAPYDFDCSWEKIENAGSFSLSGKDRNFIPVLKGFDPKIGYTKKWISEKGNTLTEEELFKEKGQVGILKKSDKKRNEEGFYKQFFRHLKKDFCFSFYIKLENRNGAIHPSGETIMHCGKERSPFLIKFKKVETEGEIPAANIPAIKASELKGLTKMVLLSDAFVSKEIYHYTDCSVNETLSFRYLQTSVSETQHYYNLARNKKKTNESDAEYKAYRASRASKSAKFNLLKRGSVFYVNNLTEAKRIFEEYPEFQEIGYNQFLLV